MYERKLLNSRRTVRHRERHWHLGTEIDPRSVALQADSLPSEPPEEPHDVMSNPTYCSDLEPNIVSSNHAPAFLTVRQSLAATVILHISEYIHPLIQPEDSH